jgi:putative membrane protein
MNPREAGPRLHVIVALAVVCVLAWSVAKPRDLFTWFLEMAPVPIAAALIAWAYPRWRFTPLALVLAGVHAVILLVGAKYTYAEVPLFNWMRDEWGLARNYYDRVGHFAQGFVPAIVAREILVRHAAVKRGAWLFVLVTGMCLAVSALYEFIEWGAALATGEAADAFLGTQGDPWDTQWDMFLAFCGAIAAQLLLGRRHDRLLEDQVSGGGAPAGSVTLREITPANIDWVGEVRVVGEQRFHVASVAKTFWQASGRDDVWMRAIYAGEEPVGFVALRLRGEEAYLARLIVDFRHQGRGYGKEAIRLVIEQARALPGCNRVTLSHVPSNARVARLYERFGFRHTGAVDDEGEVEMRLDLA